MISKSVKLPYNLAKGSEKNRFEQAANLNMQLFKSIKNKFSNSEISFYTLEEYIKKSLPEEINIEIFENFFATAQNPAKTNICIDETSFGKVCSGFRVFLPTKKDYSEMLDGSDTYIAFHEFRHFFDQICNPKITQRMLALQNKYMKKLPDVIDFFYKNIYTSQKFDKNNLNMVLQEFSRKYSNSENIDFLQFFRYIIKTEQNAFGDGYRFQTLMNKMLSLQNDNLLSAKAYNFSSKIRILEKNLSEQLCLARKNLK